MEVRLTPNWIKVSSMLNEAIEQYQDQHYYSSLLKVIDKMINYIEKYSGKWLNEKTVKRDAGNRPDRKRLYHIPGIPILVLETETQDERICTKKTQFLHGTRCSCPGVENCITFRF